MKKQKYITSKELIDLLPEQNRTQDYLSWTKMKISDLNSFEFVGNLKVDYFHKKEFETNENYWSDQYPIAFEYFPNSSCSVYTDGFHYYLVYKDFGGHSPEQRCRLVQKDLIVYYDV